MIMWMTVGATAAIFWIVIAVIVAMALGRVIDAAEAHRNRPTPDLSSRRDAPGPLQHIATHSRK